MSEDELKRIAEKYCSFPTERGKKVRTTEAFRSKDVIKLVDISWRQLDYWIRTGLATSSIFGSEGKGSKRIYSFFDLIQIRTIKALLDSGMSIKKTRNSMDYIERELSFPFPAAAILVTDGKSNIQIVKTKEELISAVDGIVHKKQGVFFIHIGKFKKEIKKRLSEMNRRAK